MTTITKGASTITPTQVLGYEATSESTNVVHRKVGGGEDVSLGDDAPRSGTLQLFFDSNADAWEAHGLHTAAGVLHLSDTDFPALDMDYVREGQMSIKLDDDTMSVWLLAIGFREVIA